MDQITDVLEFFSMGIKLLSNYYSGDPETRRRFADELGRRLEEAADEDNRLLRLDLADCADFAELLRAVCAALGEEAGQPETPLSGLQKAVGALDRRLFREEKCVCLLIENFDLCERRWAEADFGWFRNLLYSSDVFSCVTVSDRHIDLFAHAPSMGSALSNIFTVAEEIGGAA